MADCQFHHQPTCFWIKVDWSNLTPLLKPRRQNYLLAGVQFDQQPTLASGTGFVEFNISPIAILSISTATVKNRGAGSQFHQKIHLLMD